MEGVRSRSKRAVAAGVAVIVAACGVGVAPAPTAEVATPDANATPYRAPYGLDARPPNPSCGGFSRPGSAGRVRLERRWENVRLGFVVAMAQPPGDRSRWVAITQDGWVYSFPSEGAPAYPRVAFNLKTAPTYPVSWGGECGLLGLAFHPKFPERPELYISYTTKGGPVDARSMIARLKTTDGADTFGDLSLLLGPFDQPSANHKGGALAFGPDGYLYASFGDGKDPVDWMEKSQGKTSFFSKILRLDVDGPPDPGRAYAIPPDNPWKNGGGEPATFARGFRNPYRFSIDRATGDVWVGDVGEAKWEEIDKVLPGGNYGWPCREGFAPASPCPGKLGFLDPVSAYDHFGPTGTRVSRAIIGGYVYRGSAIPWLVGSYVYADFVGGEVWALSFDPVDAKPIVKRLNPEGPKPLWTGLAEDNDGELYVLSGYTNAVYKIVPDGAASPPEATAVPERLSATGCLARERPSELAPGAIPYAVNVPHWADGATIERAFALRDGRTMHVGTDGRLVLPVGSVALQTFSVDGKRVETRMLVRHEDGEWSGYSYEWLDDGSDAVLLPSSKTKRTGTSPAWHFPSRSACVECHRRSAGHTLGLELPQLQRDLQYGLRISNQLATLEHIGVFDNVVDLAKVAAFPDPRADGAVDPRARAYLHVNCAPCHGVENAGRASVDLRFFARSTRGCDQASSFDDLEIPEAKIIAPGAPERSLLTRRMRTLLAPHMPPLASRTVDVGGADLLDAWIASMSACP